VLSLIGLSAGVCLIAAESDHVVRRRDQLGDEHIVVSDDADHSRSDVQDPLTAYAQPTDQETRAYEASDGSTYAQLPDDPVRQT
jgi:hypothetical protein